TSDYEAWETPFGKISADHEFCEALDIEPDNRAHALEHSGEVQLPMLQYFYPNSYRLVVITMNHQTAENAFLLAQRIAKAVQNSKKRILVIATSDFSHYESATSGAEKDQHVIDQILSMSAQGIEHAVKKYSVSACGYGPIMTLVEYARMVGVQPSMVMLRRGHSGEVVPSNQVVNYASFLCYDSGIN
ncbi:MAG TPA: AmmeMemoRadiSam system protein B, partial [Sunxiuqinia sp.]|nr:AmmeMemoRadiSam system protein B [Sunxiuqinia sp.]